MMKVAMRLWWVLAGCWAACGEPRVEGDSIESDTDVAEVAEVAIEATPEADVARDEDTAEPEVTLPERATFRALVGNTWPLTGVIAGARVSLYDQPEVSAISDADGYVTLEVARDRRVIALIEAEGYMDTLLVLPAPRDQDVATSIYVLEVGQLASIYRADAVGTTLAPEPGSAHIKMTVVHPVPSFGMALGATLEGADRAHYAPWPPNVAPVAAFESVTARGQAYVPNVAPTPAYAMTATSGFGAPCESAASSGDYEPDFDVPLRADTLTVGFVVCPVPEDEVLAFGNIRDHLGTVHGGQLGTVYVPNVDPDVAPDRLFRLRFAAPLPQRCLTPWFEDPQTLLVPPEPGHWTRVDIGPCE